LCCYRRQVLRGGMGKSGDGKPFYHVPRPPWRNPRHKFMPWMSVGFEICYFRPSGQASLAHLFPVSREIQRKSLNFELERAKARWLFGGISIATNRITSSPKQGNPNPITGEPECRSHEIPSGACRHQAPPTDRGSPLASLLRLENDAVGSAFATPYLLGALLT
jgi:hypothetical protein